MVDSSLEVRTRCPSVSNARNDDSRLDLGRQKL